MVGENGRVSSVHPISSPCSLGAYPAGVKSRGDVEIVLDREGVAVLHDGKPFPLVARVPWFMGELVTDYFHFMSRVLKLELSNTNYSFLWNEYVRCSIMEL
ncbi:MAG: hypothetical protein P4L59_16840 [Desulfosporosinus sp.]|nr:hypothetical protein [Desulfosporosinus sp.]